MIDSISQLESCCISEISFHIYNSRCLDLEYRLWPNRRGETGLNERTQIMTVTLESLRGRVGDVDAHEFIPIHRFPEFFGEVGQRFIDNNKGLFQTLDMVPETHPHRLTKKALDNEQITEQTVWEKKGIYAPGHANFDRRLAVMDKMGVQRELVFPGFGLLGLIQSLGGGQGGIPVATPEEISMGREAIGEHNRWAGHLTRMHPARLRIVGMISTGDLDLTPQLLTKRAQDVIDLGVKAIQISSGEPPAGLSPADPKLDPFYAVFAQTGTVLTFHPPSQLGYRKTDAWEVSVRPDLATAVSFHQAMENFLGLMIVGGVFDRHPTLRVGMIETLPEWIGPMIERLESRGEGAMKLDLSHLALKPSEYVVRNVRASVLLGEPIERWLERWPYLQDVLCWSSDYPHIEGGQWALQEAFRRVAPFGDDVVEKYFVKNSALIFD